MRMPDARFFAGLLISVGICVTGYSWFIGAPKARLAVALMNDVIQSIHPPENAVRIGEYSAYKSDHGMMQYTYRCTSAWEELQTHYDSELTKNGWTIGQTKVLREWGQVTGAMVKHYKRNELDVALQCSGTADDPRTYSLAISWGGRQ